MPVRTPYDALRVTAAHDTPKALEAGERIGGPLARRRRTLMRRLALIAVLAAGAGWAWHNPSLSLPEWATGIVSAVSPATALKAPAAIAPPLPPLQQAAVSEPPSALTVAAERPEVTAALAPALAVPETEPEAPAAAPEKLPLPVADPAAPNQARALAAGLHPDLARVLLARLSATDYRNAGIAIKTAVAETADTDIFVWPQKRTPDLALFQVKYVSGTVPDCRRYVVMVTKDGWSTTALPMEKCGVRRQGMRK